MIHRPPWSCLCDRHQSAAAVNVSQREFMPTSAPLSSCLLLNPSEISPNQRFCGTPCIRAALMKGIIHYKVFDLSMIYSPFSLSREGGGKKEKFLEISCGSICNIQKGHQRVQIVYRR